jgi:hypothetical protein
LIAAYERGVRDIMDLGAGGVFVDNVHPHPQCFGPKLGLHTHDWPEKNNVECYKIALDGVHKAVKSYGKDRVVILNPGGPNPEYAAYGDSMMWESFVWRSAFDGDKPPLVKTRLWEPRSWKELLDAYKRWRPSLEKGGSIAPLTYLPEPATEYENAFYAYAVARLAGFEQWTAQCVRRRDILRRLYRVRTGKAISDLTEVGDAAYRQFENALIVCNHSTKPVEIKAPLPPALRTSAVELFDVRKLPIVDGCVSLTLPAESGRVIVSGVDALDNVLREIEGQSLAARLHLEEKKSATNDASLAALKQALQDIQTRTAAMRKTLRQTGFPTDADRDALARLSKDAAAIQTPAGSDPFLTERLDNLRRHAELTAAPMAK